MVRNAQRTNTPTEQNKENQDLILYRLQLVEDAVKSLSSKFDRMDTIKKADLMEFKNVIIERITDVNDDLQKQIDKKADVTTVDDIKRLVYGFAGVLITIITSYIIWTITKG